MNRLLIFGLGYSGGAIAEAARGGGLPGHGHIPNRPSESSIPFDKPRRQSARPPIC